VAEWGAAARAALEEFGPLNGFDSVQQRVHDKLGAEPIEDLRIDFEDGYGIRPDGQEDEHAWGAARELAAAMGERTAPAFVGLRIKSFEGPVRRRGLRTLDLFLDGLAASGPVESWLPTGFRITLPKVTSVVQVAAMVEVCDALEARYELPAGRLRFEIQIETPQAVLGPGGSSLIGPMIHTAAGRCAGLHYGTYDYSASVGIAAAYQSMEHPAADFAKAVMQVAAAGTGVPVSDGSTNVLPVGSTDAVRAGWDLHARLVRRSLERGFYQGWDLHPAQLPTRFAATFLFFTDGLAAAAARLRAYQDRSESGILDEPATAQALAGYLLRGLDCGAVSDADIAAQVGIPRKELEHLARRA
jgi:citrate lyase beta subunit